MKRRMALTPACFGLWVLIFLGVKVLPLYGQFTDEKDADAKMLMITSCTACHGPSDLRERVSSRAGKDKDFWTALIWKMDTSWDAKIPEDDISSIANFFVKYGNCTVCHTPSSAEKNSVASNSETANQPDKDANHTTGKGDALKGESVFKAHCEGCHDSKTAVARVGPGLKGVLRGGGHRHADGTEHSHTVEEVQQIIEAGNGIMPAMKGTLANEDLTNLLAYLKTL